MCHAVAGGIRKLPPSMEAVSNNISKLLLTKGPETTRCRHSDMIPEWQLSAKPDGGHPAIYSRHAFIFRHSA